ncbi:MAG TPA: FadD3 family acyl-CoA ligase [Acidimicrobiales bacterium]|nr:FadD3 family acyl-CoA ligase [Acidimicrobiales bacterium]
MTIPAVLEASTVRFGERDAVVDGEVRLTWAALRESSRQFADVLTTSGVGPGDRVAIWAPNSWQWIVAVFGIWDAGATLVPVNTRFKGAEAVPLLARSAAKALVTVSEFLGVDYLAMLEGADLPALQTRIRLDSVELVAPGASSAHQASAVADDDVSDILFTSGTTGVPKGVVMTHARTLQVARDWVAMTRLSPDDRYLMVNPYFHMFGLKAGILACTVAGATMYPEAVFDVGVALERVSSERITVFPGAPTIYQSILDHPNRARDDLSSLRLAVTGAADIPVELIRRVRDELPFEVIISGYGLSEAGTATATDYDDDPETVATTVGRARPGFEIRIVDGERDLVVGEAGEILLRGPSVMLGYLDDAEATAAAKSDDGWLRTGDLGVLDECGNLRIVGRIKDMFIVGGFNAYPAEIENALLRHPDVREAAVIGIPDGRLGEVGVAFVVTASDDPKAADAIRTWCKAEMANYKVPRAVRVVGALPRNAGGKVVKDDLRAMVDAS